MSISCISQDDENMLHLVQFSLESLIWLKEQSEFLLGYTQTWPHTSNLEATRWWARTVNIIK